MDRCTSDKKTQVNYTKEGLAGQEEPTLGPDWSKKGPTQRTRGAKRESTKKPERRRGETRGATQEKVEEEEERKLCLTPCSVFKVVAFVCSESIIPVIPNGKGDRFLCFIHCSQATYFVPFGFESSYVNIWCSFA